MEARAQAAARHKTGSRRKKDVKFDRIMENSPLQADIRIAWKAASVKGLRVRQGAVKAGIKKFLKCDRFVTVVW